MGQEIFKVVLLALPKDLRMMINQQSQYTALHITRIYAYKILQRIATV